MNRLEAVLAHLETHFDAYLLELIEFARIPSVSTDPAFKPDVARAARWVADRLGRAGVPSVEILKTPGHPVVYAEWISAPDAPTILIYGHYDVQPPDPLKKWHAPPFEPEVRFEHGEERLYARGVSDDKGPMLIPILVAEAFGTVSGQPPVNLKFLFEGEEEVGSEHLGDVVNAHAARLKADFVLSADGAMWRAGVSSLNISSRGLIGLEFTLTGPAKDLHSGRHGGAVQNPLTAMARLVSSLHTADGRVAVEGFYDRVLDLPRSELEAIRAIPFDDAAYLQGIGATQAFGEPGYGTLERQWTRPTLELNGLWGGYQGPGGKTVIPSQAHAKITCRLVPDQHPEDLLALVVKHLRTHCPPGVRLEITTDKKTGKKGAFPYAIPTDHVGLDIARRVLKTVDGHDPIAARMGGTLPIADTFKELLGLEIVFFSFSTGDEDFHAPNEFFRVARFKKGIEAWARYWHALAEVSS
jgi:acetylornithine deacetylase/succinyl-diaminopimelate desuccinylase-like protein